MNVTDMFGNQKEVTDLAKAITQCKWLSGSPYKMPKFHYEEREMESEHTDLSGRPIVYKYRATVEEGEAIYTVGQYNAHLLTALEELQKQLAETNIN